MEEPIRANYTDELMYLKDMDEYEIWQHRHDDFLDIFPD